MFAPAPRHTMDWQRVEREFGFSPRELEVLQLLHDGFLLKQIANRLECSYHTVSTHVRRIYRKVGENRRDQALLKVVRVGLQGP